MRIYLDHNATSPLRPIAQKAMLECLGKPLNASSIHGEGREGCKKIEQARSQVAALVGVDPKGVTFTSGGTEANNTVLSPHLQFGSEKRYFEKLFVSSIEHPCVLSGGRFRQENLNFLPVDENGIVKLDALAEILNVEEAPFVSVMAANNETGVIQPIEEISKIVHEANGFLHVDAVQAAGKMNIDIFEYEADVMTLSAHKIGGPQGVGAIVRRSPGLGIPALLKGGGQELGYRAGTENVAAIAGFGAAAEEACLNISNDDRLQKRLEAGLKMLSSDFVIFADEVARLPNTTCFAKIGKKAETALISYDMAGIAVSSGSACSSGKVGPSHVLQAMGFEGDLALGAIRVSTGWNTVEDDIDSFLNVTRRFYG